MTSHLVAPSHQPWPRCVAQPVQTRTALVFKLEILQVRAPLKRCRNKACVRLMVGKVSACTTTIVLSFIAAYIFAARSCAFVSNVLLHTHL
jgi:hypothetical protein